MEVGVILEVGGKPVAVMFDLVHSRQRVRAGARRERGLDRGSRQAHRRTRANMGLARQITAEFMAALLASGAIDTTARA